MEDADGVGEVGNAKCGDIMKMYIKVKDGVLIDEIQYLRLRLRHCCQLYGHRNDQGQAPEGCPGPDQQSGGGSSDGLPAHKIHCSVLAEEAVSAAILDYCQRNCLPLDPALSEPAGGTSCAATQVPVKREVPAAGLRDILPGQEMRLDLGSPVGDYGPCHA